VFSPPRCVRFLAVSVPLIGGAAFCTLGQPARATESADNAALLRSLEAEAQQQWRAGDLARVASLRRRALHVAIAAFGPETPATVRKMAALARAYINARLWLDAEAQLIVAARIVSDVQRDALAAAIFAGLARVALARGDPDGALAWAESAVASARRDKRHGSAEPLRALGAALAARERFAEARPILDEALALDRQLHGIEAVETARSLSQLGNLYLRWGRPEEALPPLQEAAAIDQTRLGPAHPFIADDLHDLGLAYEALNRPEQARRLFLAALAVLERGPGGKTSSAAEGDAGSGISRDTSRTAYTELAFSRIERHLGHEEAAEAAFRDARRILDAAEAEERRRERRA
jgi:tetratricopeptide (TPR) repeat protein